MSVFSVVKSDSVSSRWHVKAAPLPGCEWRGHTLVLKLPTKRAAVALADMLNASELDRDRTERVVTDIARYYTSRGIDDAHKHAQETLATVAQQCGLVRPMWWKDFTNALP